MINIKRFVIGVLVAFCGHRVTLAQQGSVGAEVTSSVFGTGVVGFSFKGAFEYTLAVFTPNLNVDARAYVAYAAPSSSFDGEFRASVRYGIPIVQGDWMMTATVNLSTALFAFASPNQRFDPTSDVQWLLFSLIGIEADGSVAPGVLGYVELVGGLWVNLLQPRELGAALSLTVGLSTSPSPELEFKPALLASISAGVSENNFTLTSLGLEAALNYAFAPNVWLSAKPAVETSWGFSGFEFRLSLGVQYKF